MFSTVLGILCGVFIAADYFGYHQLNGFWYFMCWAEVILDACRQDIKIWLPKSDDSKGGQS